MKFSHWLPNFLGVTAITIGHTVYFKNSAGDTPKWLVEHEVVHILQYIKFEIFGWEWTGIIRFFIVYLYQWVSVGFRYSKIPLEIEAKEEERKHRH